MTTSDRELEQDILDELRWEPSLDSSGLSVVVAEGVVTLKGLVQTYGEKLQAERVAKRIYGVKAVVNEAEVSLSGIPERSDTDIVRSAVNAIEWNTAIPRHRVEIAVEGGWVTVDGEVDWEYQKQAAENAVRHLAGVKGVANRISVRPKLIAADVQQKIEAALRASAEIDARRISVETSGGAVVLRGEVRSSAERQDAVHAALSAPGVSTVEDLLLVKP